MLGGRAFCKMDRGKSWRREMWWTKGQTQDILIRKKKPLKKCGLIFPKHFFLFILRGQPVKDIEAVCLSILQRLNCMSKAAFFFKGSGQEGGG